MIIKKKFNLKDCSNYRKITKDNNKIHYDPEIKKYSSYNQPIVYATLILEFLIKKLFKFDSTVFDLNAIFKKPIFVNEKIYIKIKLNNHEGIRIVISNYYEDKVFINFFHKNIFYNNYQSVLISQLRKLTKYIGNYKKNINIIYSINLKCKKNSDKTFLKRINKNFYIYENFNKSISSQASFISYKKDFEFLKSGIPRYNNSDKNIKNNILIIGCFSGLGMILSKFFNYNNIRFTGTYNKNRKFISSKNYFKLDILKINKKILEKISSFNKIYYFVIPKIFNYGPKMFDEKVFSGFNKINVQSLNKILDYLSKKDKKYKIFIPSTEMASVPWDNSEYSLSKISQEIYIRLVNKKFKNVNIVNPRLGAFYTNSTRGLAISNANYDSFISSAVKIL